MKLFVVCKYVLCQLCQTCEIENEYQYVLKCPTFVAERKNLISIYFFNKHIKTVFI